ncbi:hypothetical protein AVEN_125004-1 [Araneus ventricosus]|uniref:Uncharacterized protein n=1 Tax=Araneus ventricosus TaxID=182803 RepID=A0A4Y2ED61_ARAVE|nr:hypothetical protein AVEN_125004-1 [Araneus ventricosus]
MVGSRHRGRRIPGSSLDSTEYPPCMLVCSTLNHTYGDGDERPAYGVGHTTHPDSVYRTGFNALKIWKRRDGVVRNFGEKGQFKYRPRLGLRFKITRSVPK